MQIFKIPNKKKKKIHKVLNFKGKRATTTRKGSYLIKSISKQGFLLTFNQLSAFRKKIIRFFKPRAITLRWRIFPNYPFTHKSLGMRMGKGKGSPSSIRDWKADCRSGRIIFIIEGRISENTLKILVSKASYKLPKLKIKIVAIKHNRFQKKNSWNKIELGHPPTHQQRRIKR